eukprot:GHVL01005767.1.p1 GENE.GHVL01005767.1~~GHVL01005767.1.p1  ORF type:complete len:137 (+),score=32.07 GHVL01005767.1:246-656(+)
MSIPLASTDSQIEVPQKSFNIATTSAPCVQTDISRMSEEQRRELRARKFGTANDKSKLIDRAKRFDLPCKEREEEKLANRASRFRIGEESDEVQKRKARAQRFNVLDPDLEEERKKQRTQRFSATADMTLEETLKK